MEKRGKTWKEERGSKRNRGGNRERSGGESGQKGWELEKKWRGIRTEGVGARREMVGNQGRRVKQGDKRLV